MNHLAKVEQGLREGRRIPVWAYHRRLEARITGGWVQAGAALLPE